MEHGTPHKKIVQTTMSHGYNLSKLIRHVDYLITLLKELIRHVDSLISLPKGQGGVIKKPCQKGRLYLVAERGRKAYLIAFLKEQAERVLE